MNISAMTARLALVQAAINAILQENMQSYDLDGQKITRLDLGWLSREENLLETRIARASRRRGAFSVASPR